MYKEKSAETAPEKNLRQKSTCLLISFSVADRRKKEIYKLSITSSSTYTVKICLPPCYINYTSFDMYYFVKRGKQLKKIKKGQAGACPFY